MPHAARLAGSSHVDMVVNVNTWKRRTDVNCPPFDLFRVSQLIWMEYLPRDLPALVNRTTNLIPSLNILTETSFCGVILLLSTLPVRPTTSVSDSWVYKRTVSPSRGITMQDPFAEWITVRLRISGKSVSGTISTTPQM